MDHKIGIIGLGYVGNAVKAAFSKNYNIYSFDINQNCSEKTLKAVVEKSDIIFICVPTPMQEDGSCHTEILFQVITDINNCGIYRDVVIKSTIPPHTSDVLQQNNKNINIIFNPEFMTEANFYNDFMEQKRIILSGNKLEKVVDLYSVNFPQAKIVKLSFEEAEIIKYFSNTFLATKVSFANEIYSLCEKLGINYNAVIDALVLDERIGNSHLSVPGPDGKRGFGGSCFPKDLAALIKIFKDNKISSPILDSVWKRNNDIDRKDQDWKKLKGRAVVKNT